MSPAVAFRLLVAAFLAASVGCSAYPAPNYLAVLLSTRLGSAGATPSANPIKSESSFVTTLSPNPQTMAISSVDTTRSFVYCTFRHSNANPYANRMPTCSLTSPTQVTVEAGIVDATITVRAYVLEFASGVSVQRGTATLNGGILTSTVPINAVNVGKSFVIVQARTTDGGTLIDEHRTVIGYLQDSTNLKITRNQGTIITTVEWQVVEMQGATVQAGQTAMGAVNSLTIPISAVDMSRSFVIASIAGDNLSNGNDSEIWVRCDLGSSTQVVCNRNDTTNSPTIAWQVVSFTDNTFVDRGTIDTNVATPPANNTDTSISVTPSIALDTSRTMAIGSMSVDPGDLDSGQDSAAFTLHLLTSTQMNVGRGSADDRRALISWQLVQFANE